MGDSYLWLGAASGSWNDASNWQDVTEGAPATVAPGVNDFVTIDAAAGGATTVITGTGASASLTLTGGTTLLDGQFSTGQLDLTGAGPSLDLDAGDTLSVSGALATVGYSGSPEINVDGGVLTVGGDVSFAGSLSVGLGGSMTVGGDIVGGANLSVYGGALTVEGAQNTGTINLSVSGGAVAQLAGGGMSAASM